MYAQHFGLTQDPFSIAPDPRYLFMSERHREALAHLLYAVGGTNQGAGGTGGGFVLLTGDIGTGKTTICRCFLEQIPAACHVAYIFNPKLTVIELLQAICEEFHITLAPGTSSQPTLKPYVDALNAFLLRSHAAGQSSVLIIDEAQNLEADVLEQLRLLTNLETSERKLLQIVLIGQPELRAMLERPALEQLAQRVIARFHLDALTDAETAQYIAHRLAVAGQRGPSPFDRRALRHIHRLARGVPRRINLLCGRALLGAWANGLHQINAPVVNRAAAEVFGAENGRQRRTVLWRTAWGLGGLVLLGSTALAVGWLSANRQETLAAPGITLPTRHASASAPAPVAPPVQRPVEELDTLLAQLPPDINAAWRALATLWQLPASSADPCQAATAQQLQCYRAANLTLPLLRQLGRPGILTLQFANRPPVYALLVGLGQQNATLQIGTTLHNVRLVALGHLWRGDFATYWRLPPAYSGELHDGSSGPAIARLADQLNQLDGLPAAGPLAPATKPQLLDAALRERVRAFQRTQGIKADGLPGPMTFMQLDNATVANEPRLITDQR